PALTYTLILSFVAGVVFLYSKNLSYTVALHSVNNMVVFYKSYLPLYAIVATPLLLLIIIVPAFVYIGKHWDKIRSSILFSRNWYWSKRQRESDGGPAAACLIVLGVASYVYLFPLYVYSNGSARFYLLGSLGWSPFQLPSGLKVAQPDPLLLPVISILFSVGLIILLAGGVHRKRAKRGKAHEKKKINEQENS
nr:hypothetical protein [Candidatus Njordarchaeum guaymaensis]